MSGAYPKNAQEVLDVRYAGREDGRKLTPGAETDAKPGSNRKWSPHGKADGSPRSQDSTIIPLRAIQGYEELYTTEDFPDIYNPELNDRNTKIFTKIDGITASTSSSIKQEKLDEVKEEAGGEGTFYIYPLDYTATYVGVAAVLLLIIACGYFLIYNIFYISVVNDIRFMGEMKTIGMTGRQIRTMLRHQVRRLGVVGIAIGILAGTLMNLMTVRNSSKVWTLPLPGIARQCREFFWPCLPLLSSTVTVRDQQQKSADIGREGIPCGGIPLSDVRKKESGILR